MQLWGATLMAHNGVCSCCGITVDEAITDFNEKKRVNKN